MSQIRNGHTKEHLYASRWPDADKIPIDVMWSSCAAGILGSYCYDDVITTIKSVANALPYSEETYQQVVSDRKKLFSWRRTFLVFADGVEGKTLRGGRALEKYILDNKLGPVVTLGKAQNKMYSMQHECQIWLWYPDWDAIDAIVKTYTYRPLKDLF